MSDKWIRNEGGCPVERGTLVDVKYRNGEENFGLPALVDCNKLWRDASSEFWTLDGVSSDIEFWRLHKEPFFGLEEAYSQPVAASYDKTYYTRPSTKAVEPSKKSAEQIVADAFNQQWGINLREDDIQRIIVAVQALKDLEK